MRRLNHHYFYRYGIYKIICIFLIFIVSYVTFKSFFFEEKPNVISIPLFGGKKISHEFKIGEGSEFKSALSLRIVDQKMFRKSCPLCLGVTICDSLEMGAFEVLSKTYVEGHKTVHIGMWHKSSKVLLKISHQEKVNVFKLFACQNMTKNNDCEELRQNLSFLNNFFSINSIRNIHKITSQKQSDIPAVLCVTEKMIAHFKSVYDFNSDMKLSDSEKLMLYTSLAVDPEAFIHMFLSKSSIDLPVPHFYGVCGQTLIIEDSGTPLIDHIYESFDIRAALAYQILQMVEDLLEEDADWLFIFTDFNFHNLAVKEDGDVILRDVSSMAIVDKSLLIKSYDKGDRPCNEACFRFHSSQLFKSKNVNQACSKLAEISHMMYAIVCRNIFLNVNDMKSEIYNNSKPVGLLHTMPSKDKMVFNELLEECVQETSYGGRIQAAEELKEVLSEYVADKDDEEDPNGEDVYPNPKDAEDVR